jgi:hypothetical protein
MQKAVELFLEALWIEQWLSKYTIVNKGVLTFGAIAFHFLHRLTPSM